jgi:DNA-binding Lrp family transcriptional regulator
MAKDIRLTDTRAHLSELDHQLLRLLQNNARQTNVDLAVAAGVAPSTSLERVRSLVQRGVITRFTAEVDLPSVGRAVQALIAVRIRPPSRRNIENFRDWVITLPEVLGLFVTSGTDDFLIHLGVPDTDALYAFVIDQLTARGVADVRTSVVYEHLRTAEVLPVDSAYTNAKHPGSRAGRRSRRTG